VIGKIFNEDVHQITGVELLRVSSNEASESHAEHEYISMAQNLLGDGSFYFSYGYDLSRACQSIATETKDGRFDWALPMRDNFFRLIKAEAAAEGAKVILKWCAPVIRGFVSITSGLKIGEIELDYILISRKGRERSGRRFTARGANKKGLVANYVETEQIISSPASSGRGYPTQLNPSVRGTVTSYVQVRGSIPLLWTQKPNLSWEPPLKIKPKPTEDHMNALRIHFQSQLAAYTRQTIVSLIKFKGSEGPLGTNFTKYIETEKPENLTYIRFDLHAEVGHTSFQNLKKLFDQTDVFLDSYGFFSLTYHNDGYHRINQTGVMRTNCKDNLDRTNLVQSRFAMKMLWHQFDLFVPNAEKAIT
jgi:hypothetical protein